MSPGPLVFPLFSFAHLGFGLLALLALPAAPAAAMCLAIVEFVTCYDNAVVAAGNRIGIGIRLERLNRARFFLHAVCIALLLPAYAGTGALAGVAAFGTPGFAVGCWAATLTLAAFGYFVGYRGVGRIMPVDSFGCLRYAQSVTPESRRPGYDYSADELAARGMPPVTSIIAVFAGLTLAIWTGISASFWLPAIATAPMLLAGAFPPRAWGAVATSCLEIVFSGGMVAALLIAAGVAG